MEQKQVLERLMNVLKQYEVDRYTGPVVRYRPYADLKDDWAPRLGQVGGQDWDQLWETVEAYLSDSVKTAHPQFFNALWAGQTGPGWIGEVIGSLANTSAYTYEVAPVVTLLEHTLLDQLKTITTFDQGEAQFTTGGSNGNMLALMLALHRHYPQVKAEGVAGLPPLAAFVSAEAHYSIDKAVNILGIGTNSLYTVATDNRGAMQIDDLEAQIKQARQDGRTPLVIVGTAGTTTRGAFDPFEDLARISEQENCSFHIDGAWGGSIILSNQHRHLLKGIEKADSFVWDAHKMLGLPLMCSMLFVREAGQFQRSFDLGNSDYIFHGNNYDLGPKSVQCGRRVDILKWWLEWQFYGPKGLEKRVDRFISLSQYAQARIEKESNLELLNESWINNICFRYVDDRASDLNNFNHQLRMELYQSGQSFVKIGTVKATKIISLVLTNQAVTEADVDHFFDQLLETAQQLLKKSVV